MGAAEYRTCHIKWPLPVTLLKLCMYVGMYFWLPSLVAVRRSGEHGLSYPVACGILVP